MCYSLDVDVDGSGPNEFHPGHCKLQPQPHLLPMVSPHCKWANISIMRMNMVMIMLIKMKMILVMHSIYQIGTNWESFPQINPDEQTMSSVVSNTSQLCRAKQQHCACLCLHPHPRLRPGQPLHLHGLLPHHEAPLRGEAYKLGANYSLLQILNC